MIKEIKEKIIRFGRWIKSRSKKFWLKVGAVTVGGTVLAITMTPSDKVFGDIRDFPELEITTERTYNAKIFEHPTSTDLRIAVVGAGLLHYMDETGFEDLLPLEFPEGNVISAQSNKHLAMELPTWGEYQLSNNSTTLKILDKQGTLIYYFEDPFVIEQGIDPYQVINKETKQVIKETSDREEELRYGEELKLKEDVIDKATFKIEGNNLYLELPPILKNPYPLQMYDDEYAASTTLDGHVQQSYGSGSGITWSALTADSGTSNYELGSEDFITYSYADNVSNRWRELRRFIFVFDVSAISGTVTDVDFKIYIVSVTDAGNQKVAITYADPVDPADLANGDYANIGTSNDVGRFATDIDLTDLSTGAYNTFAFNSTGTAAVQTSIDGDGLSKIGTKSDDDIDSVDPGWGSNLEWKARARLSEYAGATSDPVLVITYSLAVTRRIMDVE